MHSARIVAIGAAWAAIAAHPVAQQPVVPRFDVVSIKPNRSGDVAGRFAATPAGRFAWTNTTVGTIISVAYQRFAFDQTDVVGAPDWADRERFDVVVQTGNGPPPMDASGFPSVLTAMLRNMLAERFQLTAHFEKRDRPVYLLQLARPGGALSKGLTRVDAGCGAALADLNGGTPLTRREGRGPDCSFGGPPGQLQGNAVSIEMLGRVLGAGTLDRRVVDRTGISGNFDIDLRFRPDPGALGGGPPGVVPVDPDAPSIFTAVEEQLGLKLVPDRAPVDVLVIDRLERPAAD
jgi:uncharacterized protein (TIGR03435 family)